jgi:hypothetical protein
VRVCVSLLLRLSAEYANPGCPPPSTASRTHTLTKQVNHPPPLLPQMSDPTWRYLLSLKVDDHTQSRRAGGGSAAGRGVRGFRAESAAVGVLRAGGFRPTDARARAPAHTSLLGG